MLFLKKICPLIIIITMMIIIILYFYRVIQSAINIAAIKRSPVLWDAGQGRSFDNAKTSMMLSSTTAGVSNSIPHGAKNQSKMYKANHDEHLLSTQNLLFSNMNMNKLDTVKY